MDRNQYDQVLSLLEYKIDEAYKFEWSCFGDYAHTLDFHVENGSVSMIFDRQTLTIYSLTTYHYCDDVYVEWVNPLYWSNYVEEHRTRDIPFTAQDAARRGGFDTGRSVTFVLGFEEMLGIVAGFAMSAETETSSDGMVDMDLDMDVAMRLALHAHKRDVTLNQYLTILLTEYVERYDRGEISLPNDDE